MKYIKENGKYILLLTLFTIWAAFFTLPISDLTWLLHENVSSVWNFLTSTTSAPIISTLALLFSKMRIVQVITQAILTVCLFVTMRNIINKKNDTILYIGIFIFLLINSDILLNGYISINGLCKTFIPMVLILIIINYIVKDNLYKLKKPIIFILGLIASSFSLEYALALNVTLIFLSYRKKISNEKDTSLRILLMGSLIGLALLISYYLAAHINPFGHQISANLLHTLVPNIYSINFMLSLIEIALLLFSCVRVYKRTDIKDNAKIILSISIITLYGLCHLLSNNDTLNYIVLIFYNIFSLYILLNLNNSTSFKDKIKMYYLFKIVYFIVLAFTPYKDIGNLLFIVILEILTVLELVNFTLPNNFLKLPWILVTIIILLSNCYLSKMEFDRRRQMDIYIKRELSCGKEHILIANKYKNLEEFYLPKNDEEKALYAKYLSIPFYGKYEIIINDKDNSKNSIKS